MCVRVDRTLAGGIRDRHCEFPGGDGLPGEKVCDGLHRGVAAKPCLHECAGVRAKLLHFDRTAAEDNSDDVWICGGNLPHQLKLKLRKADARAAGRFAGLLTVLAQHQNHDVSLPGGAEGTVKILFRVGITGVLLQIRL